MPLVVFFIVAMIVTLPLWCVVVIGCVEYIKSIKEKKEQALLQNERAKKYKYFTNNTINNLTLSISDNHVEKKIIMYYLLTDIEKKHKAINNLQGADTIKGEIEQLLNVQLVKIVNDFESIYNAGMAKVVPKGGSKAISYEEIFVDHLNKIASYLDDVIEQQLASINLLNFDVNNYAQKSDLIQAEALIHPIKLRFNKILEQLKRNDNIKSAIILDKIINEYLAHAAINYQFALKQPIIEGNRNPKEVFSSILEQINRCLDDIENSMNDDAILPYNESQQNYYQQLLDFEQYLKLHHR